MKNRFSIRLFLAINLLSSPFFLNAQSITIKNKEGMTLKKVFQRIESASGYRIAYNSSTIDVKQKVNLDVTEKDVLEVIDSLMEITGYSYVRDGRYLVVTDHSEDKSNGLLQIKGKLIGGDNEPVIGASILLKDTDTYAISDVFGRFEISAPQNSVLLIKCMGYKSSSYKVGYNMKPNIKMESDVEFLDEVVVIGYGTVKKSSLTGSLSSVNDNSFRSQKVSRIDQALQGRASGVQVSNTCGAPGGEVRIRVRGANSILGDNSPLFVVDGFVGADFSSVNPNDIESIEVLKDASSTAIYGSRGANGVILITTKSGSKTGKVHIIYDGTVSVSNIIKKYDLLDAGEYAELYNEHQKAFGLEKYFTDVQIDKFYKEGGYDYVDDALRTAVSHQHQLSVDGGNVAASWRISGNYLNQQGIIANSDYGRFNVRSSVSSKVNNRLSIRFNMNLNSSVGKNNESYGSGFYGASTLLNQAIAWAPTTCPYKEDGTLLRNDPTGSLKSNPLAILFDSEHINKKTYLTLLAGANYEILKGMSINFQAAYDQMFSRNNSWNGQDAASSASDANANKSNNEATTVQTTSQISYLREFGKHSINAIAAFETQSFYFRSTWANALGLIFPQLKYDNLSQATTFQNSSSYSMWSLVSGLARVNYGFDERYLVSLSVRHDGSSKFSSANKFSTFPAAAFAWNAKNESFMNDVDAISTLKLRTSWGLTGSQAINPYATRSPFSGTEYPFSMGTSSSGIQTSNPANRDLKWETTEQFNVGFDFGMFDNRLLLEADYYFKTTTNLLLNKRVPSYQGGGFIVSNVGSIRNTGFDFSLISKIIEKRELSLESTFNFSVLRNKVLDLGDEEVVYICTNVTGISDGAYDFIYKVGEPLGTMYGLKYLGPWQRGESAEAAKYNGIPGDARYEDVDGNNIYDSNDYQIIGHSMPKCTLGWNTNFRYKNLSMNMFFQGMFGLQKMNYNRCINMMAARDVRGATFSEVKDRYIPGVNEDAYLPAWSPSSTWFPVSSLWMENGSYLRLKNLSPAYDFHVEKVGGFTVSLNATNFFTITDYKGIDPEASNEGGGSSDLRQGSDYGAYPNSRTVTLGLNICF